MTKMGVRLEIAAGTMLVWIRNVDVGKAVAHGVFLAVAVCLMYFWNFGLGLSAMALFLWVAQRNGGHDDGARLGRNAHNRLSRTRREIRQNPRTGW
jgi:hypothetical protein